MLSGNKQGFTIVELLIVVIVIAILATITIVPFNGIQNRARDSAVQNDLKIIAQKMESFRVDPTISTTQFYPAVTAELIALNIKISSGSYESSAGNNFLYCRGSDTMAPTQWALIARSKSGNVYSVSHSSGVSRFTQIGFPNGQNDVCPPAGVPGEGKGLWGRNGPAWANWVVAS